MHFITSELDFRIYAKQAFCVYNHERPVFPVIRSKRLLKDNRNS